MADLTPADRAFLKQAHIELDELPDLPRPKFGALTDRHFESMVKANTAMWSDRERFRTSCDTWRDRALKAERRMREWRLRCLTVAAVAVAIVLGILGCAR